MGSAACQPSAEAGAGPVAERARADEFDAVGGAFGEASEMAIAVLHGGHQVRCQVTATDKPEVDTLDDPYWAGFLGIVGLALPSTLMTSCGL